MVDSYTRFLKKKLNLPKKIQIEDIMRDQEFDPNELTDAGFTLLHLAIQDEEEELVIKLLKPPSNSKYQKADPNVVCTDKGWSALIYAICYNPQPSPVIINACLKNGSSLDLQYDGRTPAEWAAYMGQIETLKELQRMGADLKLVGDKGSLLHHCVQSTNDHPECVNYLLEQGIDWKAVTVEGKDSVLHYCVLTNGQAMFMHIIKQLMAQLLDESDTDQVREDKRNQIKELLNIQNVLGNTVLHEASLKDQTQFMNRIKALELVDFSLLNNDTKTAESIQSDAKKEKFQETISKQAQITADRDRRQKQQEARRIQAQQKKKEEKIAYEQEIQKDDRPSPDDYARKIQMFFVFFLIMVMILIWFIFDFVAKEQNKDRLLVKNAFDL